MSSKLTKEQVDAILGQKNLLVRNLQITVGYYKVGRGMRKFISDRDVNWFGFGTYASKTAGRAIRHETLPGPIKSAMVRAAGYDNTYMYLHDVLETAEDPSKQNPDNLVWKVLSQVSLLLSQGNLLIFKELAWIFVDMMATFSNDWQPDDTKWGAFLDKHCKIGAIEEGGQDLLRESLSYFYQSRFETDDKKKAELILMANLLIGFHEQTRLQPVIEKALAVPFDIFTKGLIPDDDEKPDNLPQKISRRTIGFSRKMVLRSVTKMLMSYTLPTRELKVGIDLVAPTGMINFPPELLTIENPRCKELVMTFSTGMDTISGSAAHNWGNLMDRMNFLVDFFRSYQHYKPLLQKPFLDNQMSVIESGQFPGGKL